MRHFTVLKCDKSEAKSWDELWKSGEVDRNQDSLQHTQKDVRSTKGAQLIRRLMDRRCMRWTGQSVDA